MERGEEDTGCVSAATPFGEPRWRSLRARAARFVLTRRTESAKRKGLVMKRMGWWSLGYGIGKLGVRGVACACGLAALFGCSRKPTTDSASEASAAPPPASAAPAQASARSSKTAPSASASGAAESAVPSPPPESFQGGNKVKISNAVGLGCQAVTSSGWLELLCRKKNGTGGHPVRAIRDLAAFEAAAQVPAVPAPSSESTAPAGSVTAPAEDAVPTGSVTAPAENNVTEEPAPDPRLANVVEADEQGSLRVIAPWGQPTSIRIEWTDTKYDLVVKADAAQLVLPVSLALRQQCAALEHASEAVVKEAALTPTDTVHLPRFGRCQMAGLGAWAVTLDALSATGSDSTRNLSAQIGVVHLDPDGHQQHAALGTLDFAPGGLELPPRMVYDYDDDGEDELIFRYEVKRAAAGRTPAVVPGVFRFQKGEVVAYPSLHQLGPGSVSVEQLEFDMRPDVADYGPYVAWLDEHCGAKSCPGRITGPRFFARSLPDGSFSRTDPSALAALKRTCAQPPASVVIAQGKTVNVTRTASLVGCAKVWGVAEDTIVKELDEKRALLCGSDADCPLLATLRGWAARAAPAQLGE